MKKLTLSILIGAFTPCLLNAQTIQSVVPNQANAGQTLNVSITGLGTHFGQSTPATYIDFGFTQCSGTLVNSMSIVSPTSISANITVPSYSKNGNYDVHVWDPMDGLLVLDNYFHVSSTHPNLIMNPGNGLAGQILTVTISGSGTLFTQNSGTSSVDFEQWPCSSGFYFYTSNTTIFNDSLMSAVVSIPSNAPLGYYNSNVPGPYGLGNYANVFLVGTPSGLNVFKKEEQISFFPNPLSTSGRMEVEIPYSGDYVLTVFDIMGREIFRRKNVLPSGKQNIPLNVSDFKNKSGIYLIELNIDSKKYVRKLVVQK